MNILNFEDIKKNFPPRNKNTHKGDYGTLLSFCGSKTMPGASILSAKAAIYSGVGLVNLIANENLINIVASCLPEVIFTELFDDSKIDDSLNNIFKSFQKSTSCLVGCGLGQNKNTKKIIYEIIKNYDKPLVLDADGINAVAENINILKTRKNITVLTPHPGEMARLINKSASFVNDNRISCAKNFSLEHNVITVLKGNETIISSQNGEVFKCTLGNPGMATAGCGDVLAGMLSSFLSQGFDPLEASKSAVFLHSLSGDICAKKFSQISMCASNIIDTLPRVFSLL